MLLHSAGGNSSFCFVRFWLFARDFFNAFFLAEKKIDFLKLRMERVIYIHTPSLKLPGERSGPLVCLSDCIFAGSTV